MVLATQNPLDQEGTYPLPEAELDRFLFKVLIDYPGHDDETRLVNMVLDGTIRASLDVDSLSPATDAAGLQAMKALSNDVLIDAEVLDYALRIVRATRDFNGLSHGASPRASIALARAARVQPCSKAVTSSPRTTSSKWLARYCAIASNSAPTQKSKARPRKPPWPACSTRWKHRGNEARSAPASRRRPLGPERDLAAVFQWQHREPAVVGGRGDSGGLCPARPAPWLAPPGTSGRAYRAQCPVRAAAASDQGTHHLRRSAAPSHWRTITPATTC